MPRSQAYYSAYSGAPCAVLEGQVGLLALQQAASTGRLFADAGGSTVGNALCWGPARPLQWCWHELPAQPGALSAEPAWQLRAALGKNFPIMGVGGILSGADAVSKIEAGADVVQIYTGLIYRGPALVEEAALALKAAAA